MKVSIKPGFSLIEILIALAIAGFVSLMLHTFLNQTQRVVKRTDVTVHQATVLSVLYHQLEKDLSGVFVPISACAKPKKEEKLEKQDVKPELKRETPAQQKIEDALFILASGGDKQLQQLTCITNNPLTMYNTFSPRVVRVRYAVTPDMQHAGMFALVRQESSDLELKKFEGTEPAVRGYVIANSLKQLHVTCMFSKQEKNAQDKNKKEWVTEPKWSAEKDATQLVPEYIVVDGALWDERTKHAQEFKFVFALPAYSACTVITGTVTTGTVTTGAPVGATPIAGVKI